MVANQNAKNMLFVDEFGGKTNVDVIIYGELQTNTHSVIYE